MGFNWFVKVYFGLKMKVIDFKNRMVLLGFIDSYIYLIGGGICLMNCDFIDLWIVGKVLEKVWVYV